MDSIQTPFTDNRLGNLYTSANGVGIGINTPERFFHVQGDNAVWRLDRDANTVALQLHRFPTGSFVTPWKGYVIGVNATGSNDGEFVISDYATNVTGPSTTRLRINNAGSVAITTNISSTDTSTGALTVSGGLGVAGAVNSGSLTSGATAITSLTNTGVSAFAGAVSITNTTASTNTSTGALTVSGGLGVTGAVNSDSLSTGAANITSLTNTGVSSLAGIVSITNTTGSTNSSTGALVVSGGVGVSQNIYSNNYLVPTYTLFAFDNGSQSTSSNVFQNRLTINTPVLPIGTYMFSWSGLAGTTGLDRIVDFRLTIDGVDTGTVIINNRNTVQTNVGLQGFVDFATETTHTLVLQFRRNTNITVTFSRVSIYFFRVE